MTTGARHTVGCSGPLNPSRPDAIELRRRLGRYRYYRRATKSSTVAPQRLVLLRHNATLGNRLRRGKGPGGERTSYCYDIPWCLATPGSRDWTPYDDHGKFVLTVACFQDPSGGTVSYLSTEELKHLVPPPCRH
eukprot:80206-Hanusia_phi.AAC.1